MELSTPELEVLKGLESLRNPSTAEEISSFIGKSRPRTAFLLKLLERKGLTKAGRKGIKVFYNIVKENYVEIRQDKNTILKLESLGFIPKVTDIRVRKILFDFKNDMESLYKLKKTNNALKSMVRSFSSEEKESFIKNYLTSLTTVVKGFWEITDGFFTNFDFDLIPMRFDSEFLDAISDVIIEKYSEKLDSLNGLICFVGSGSLEPRSFASEVYVKNSLPIALAVSLKKNIPLIIIETNKNEKKILGEIRQYGYYGIIDDCPVKGYNMNWINKKIDEIGGVVLLNLMLIKRNDFVQNFLKENKIEFEYLFDGYDLAREVVLGWD